MTDILLLIVIVTLPALVALGPLAFLALGVAAMADLDGTGLVRPAQPAPGSSSSGAAAIGSLTRGPASRMSSVTPSA